MKHFLLSLLILFFVTSCSSGSKEKDSNEDSTNPLLVSEEPKGIDSVWNFYSGSIDDNSQFVMELSFNGENVDGNYWYVKHRKRIQLKGKIDTILQEVILTEKVNGEPTGHFKFRVDEDMLQGSWSLPMKKQAHGYKPANLYCDLIYSVRSVMITSSIIILKFSILR